ncbi:solute carrier family 35 member G1 [Mucor ambiguus]|uniref:Solute carrier family 35 member G1 n=1 Tax=Mucor ambiguus TaxID=91626 RepID=A0A0C9LQA9_9FUNG|nr:solute carrier family 35 member G1 [Mucor ambiguus]
MSNISAEDDGRVHPIPSSVIIVNEATPLLSQEQHLAGSRHAAENVTLSSCMALSQDDQVRVKELKGLLLLAASSLLFAGVSVMVRWLGVHGYPSVEIVLARACIQLPLGIIGCCIVGVNPFGKQGVRRWLFFRALASSIALLLFFYSLTKLPLIDATVIFFLGPLFKVMIGCIVMNDAFSVSDVFYSILCFVGFLFVVKPRFLFYEMQQHIDDGKSFAIACALAAALMSAMAYITVRRVGQQHVMVHVVYFGLVSVLLCIPLLLLNLQAFAMPAKEDAAYFVSVGGLAFLGQYFINIGLKLAPIGLVTLLRSIDVVFAFLFGVIIFHELPGFYTLLGSFIIVSMTSTISLHQWHRQELKNAAIKRRKSKDRLIRHQQKQQRQHNEASASNTSTTTTA